MRSGVSNLATKNYFNFHTVAEQTEEDCCTEDQGEGTEAKVWDQAESPGVEDVPRWMQEEKLNPILT